MGRGWDLKYVEDRELSSIKTDGQIQYKLLLCGHNLTGEQNGFFIKVSCRATVMQAWLEENWQEYPGFWNLEKEYEKLGIGGGEGKKRKVKEESRRILEFHILFTQRYQVKSWISIFQSFRSGSFWVICETWEDAHSSLVSMWTGLFLWEPLTAECLILDQGYSLTTVLIHECSPNVCRIN